MGKIKIQSIRLEDNYTSIPLCVRIEGVVVDVKFSIKGTQDGLIFKQDAYTNLKQAYKVLDIVRGFIGDERNYNMIKDEVVIIINEYNQSIQRTGSSSDKRYYFRCIDMAIFTLQTLAKKMGIAEDTTRELTQINKLNKLEHGVTQ